MAIRLADRVETNWFASQPNVGGVELQETGLVSATAAGTLLERACAASLEGSPPAQSRSWEGSACIAAARAHSNLGCLVSGRHLLLGSQLWQGHQKAML